MRSLNWANEADMRTAKDASVQELRMGARIWKVRAGDFQSGVISLHKLAYNALSTSGNGALVFFFFWVMQWME